MANAIAILGTAEIRIKLTNGQSSRIIRALCDSGSQLNLITEHVAQQMGLRKVKQKIPINGIGASMCASGYADVVFIHRCNTNTIASARILIVSKISSTLPEQRFDNPFTMINEEEYADPNFNIPSKIEALLGIGVWTEIMNERIIRQNLGNQSLLAQHTKLGWVISGRTGQCNSIQARRCFLAIDNDQLHDQLQRFWETEAMPTSKKLTTEEQLAEDIFVSTHQRDETGRYIVRIPWKPSAPKLGNSKNMALACFRSLERKFNKDPQLHKLYKDVIDEHRNMNHFVPAILAPEDDSQSYYIPHHAINGPSDARKNGRFRVVYHASAKTSTGVSLNDRQLIGYKQQDDLYDIFLRGRMKQFGLSADVVQMFRQIWVNECDWDYQRILWRDTPSEELKEYIITRIAWGTASASWNAVRALRQCALDESSDFPNAANIALNDFYCDDLWTGANTEDEAIEFYHDLIQMMDRGGFGLAKWVTNSNKLAIMIKQDEAAEVSLPAESGILGMKWIPATDELRFKVKSLKHDGVLTKRIVLSQIAQIYDPSGVIAPIVVLGKIFIQDLWRSGAGWDDPLPADIAEKWSVFCNNINILKEIRIPRWVGVTPNDEIELHVFADASEKAYGAVAYIRVKRTDGKIIANIISAKSRVAPLKKLTIPRLELLAALMAAQLATYVSRACRLSSIQTHLWSDSSICLHWIKRDPATNNQFVANRVTAILEHSTNVVWRHVAGVDNPADLVSRGTTSEQLKNAALWWHGPEWLATPRENWPEPTVQILSAEEQKNIQAESKTRIVAVTVKDTTNVLSIKSNDGTNNSEPLIARRSTLGSILRVTAYIQRFVFNIRKKMASNGRMRTRRAIQMQRKPRAHTPISPGERDDALVYWIKAAQNAEYAKEIEACQSKKNMPINSTILKLVPTIDMQGILRVRGRLGKAEIADDTKHPIIIPSMSTLATLLIRNAHIVTLHGGPQIMMAYLRQKFWIPKMRQNIQKQIHKCVTCIRHRQNPCDQIMADLPNVRVTQNEPFSRTGLDLAGPFLIRKHPGRSPSERNIKRTKKEIQDTTPKMKAWVILFCCMVTRAVHLDVMVSLKTEEFLAAFSRFVNRKGRCFYLMSDNGTTFVGADNEVNRAFSEWCRNPPNDELAKYQTVWKFITPAAPHMGGAWESLVRRLKHHMKRVVGDRLLTRDELYTTVTQIEGCLNSRPLWPMSDDASDLQPITPAHLLLGKPILPQPLTGDHTETPDSRLTLWGRQQKMSQQFWKRWHEEYLTSLQQRHKWYVEKRNMQVGDLVVLMDENQPTASWAMGRVTDTHPGPDDRVRSVTIKTERGEYTRPINKLCLLPPAETSNTSTRSE